MMNATSRWRMATVMALAVPFGLILALGAAQPGGQEKTAAAQALEKNPGLRKQLETKTYAELAQTLPKAKFNGKTYYFAEGDLRLDEDQLLFYARDREDQFQKYKRAQLPGLPSTGPPPGQLMMHVVNGKIMRWEPGTTLTYCVLRKTFGDDERYKMVAQNMGAATKAWADTCNMKFKYADGQDGADAGPSPPEGVTFTVRSVDPSDPGNAPIASSFFPGDPSSDRHLLLFPDYFTTNFDKVGVLRHELGHILGFRHEHIRTEAPPACRGEPIGESIPLTKYDPKSVMHYFCGNRGTKELKISALDGRGARQIYGAPQDSKAFGAAPGGPGDLIREHADAFRSVKP